MPTCCKIIWKHSLCPNWKWAKHSHKLLTWVTNFSENWLKSSMWDRTSDSCTAACSLELTIRAQLSRLVKIWTPFSRGGYSHLDTFGKGAWGEWQIKQQHQVFINWEFWQLSSQEEKKILQTAMVSKPWRRGPVHLQFFSCTMVQREELSWLTDAAAAY